MNKQTLQHSSVKKEELESTWNRVDAMNANGIRVDEPRLTKATKQSETRPRTNTTKLYKKLSAKKRLMKKAQRA